MTEMNFSVEDVGKFIYCRGFFETSTWVVRTDPVVLIQGDFFRRVFWGGPEGDWSVLTSPLRLRLDGKNAVVEYRILGHNQEHDCQVAELTSHIRRSEETRQN